MKTTILALACAVPTVLLANGGGYVEGVASNGSLGAAFQPKNAQLIEMKTEDLKIDLLTESGHVEVEYTLRNPGKAAVTAEVGFPCKAVATLATQEDGKTVKEEKATPPFQKFEVQLDGEKLEWKTVRDKAGQKDFPPAALPGGTEPYRYVPYWYTFKLPFEAGQTRKLRVRYETPYRVASGSVSEDSASDPETLTYLFSTAAVWKGPIGKGKVAIRAVGVPADQVKLNLAKRFKRDGDQWTWEFEDFEPGMGDDLNIAVHPAQVSYGRPLPGAPEPQGDELPRYVEFVKVNNQWTLHHREFTATATSRLAPIKRQEEEITYEAKNLSDLDAESIWAEGVDGDGVGQSLTLTLTPPRKVTHLAIRNGLCKTGGEALYAKNGRVAEFGVSINGGKSFTVALRDERTVRHAQLIPLPEDAGEIKTIQLTIEKVYPGAQYRDTCISDIELISPLAKAPKITPAR